jgi:hypothetical protein
MVSRPAAIFPFEPELGMTLDSADRAVPNQFLRMRSRMNTGHSLALLGAAVARIGATLTMIHIMFAAFFSTSVAYLGAKAAELLGKVRVTRHELRSEHTDVRAIPVEPDATFHHLHIVLPQAGSRAVFTFLSALQARFNATSIFFVSHTISPFLEKVGRLGPISTNYFRSDGFSGERRAVHAADNKRLNFSRRSFRAR